nr:hypothetical protein [uncultured Gellertiella sp.]
MTETAEQKIERLETRIERLKNNMLSGVSRPRIIVGAVAMELARSNRDVASALLAAFDEGKDRLIDRKTVEDFVAELEERWGLGSRDSVTAEDRARPTGRVHTAT